MQWVNGGTYAEYVSAPEEVLALKPANITFEQAASVPTSGIIALQNLQSVGLPKPGQAVLVNGAGGGVGTIALQLAKAYGADVTAVDRTEKLDMLRSLGADGVIDYTQEDFTQGSQRYDLIFDIASTLRFSDCKRVLTPTGTYLVIGHDHYGTRGRRMLGSLPQMFKLMALAPFTAQLPDANFSLPSKQELMTVLRQFLEAGQRERDDRTRAPCRGRHRRTRGRQACAGRETHGDNAGRCGKHDPHSSDQPRPTDGWPHHAF
jgi:NADPH:quinone reductase-like Zn-dependent oxidoreductase